MNTDLSEVEQRTKRYWYTDGIAELSGGFTLILIGLYFAVPQWLPGGSPLKSMLEASLALLLIGGFFLTRRLVNTLKARITYPRTGYVSYQPGPKDTAVRRWGTLLMAAAVSIMLVLWGKLVGSFDWLTAFTGLAFGLVFILLRGRAGGIQRFYLLGLFSIVLGLGLSFSGLPMGFSLGLLYGLTGLA